MKSRRVLLIEDDLHYRDLLTQLLSSAGYAVTAADSVFGIRTLVMRLRPHAILLDLGLPYRSGASLLAELRADPSTADTPILVVSGHPDVLTEERRAMVTEIFQKPPELRSLLEALRAACDRPRYRPWASLSEM